MKSVFVFGLLLAVVCAIDETTTQTAGDTESKFSFLDKATEDKLHGLVSDVNGLLASLKNNTNGPNDVQAQLNNMSHKISDIIPSSTVVPGNETTISPLDITDATESYTIGSQTKEVIRSETSIAQQTNEGSVNGASVVSGTTELPRKLTTKRKLIKRTRRPRTKRAKTILQKLLARWSRLKSNNEKRKVKELARQEERRIENMISINEDKIYLIELRKLVAEFNRLEKLNKRRRVTKKQLAKLSKPPKSNAKSTAKPKV